MNDSITCFITWTTYGTWLPGDARGWRKMNKGNQLPRPLLEDWCRNRMSAVAVVLNSVQRSKVETVCREHAAFRGWVLHAVSARSNHIHLALTADRKPELVRDQFKANATRVLRQNPEAMSNEKIWTRGGDCEIVDGDDSFSRVFQYIIEAQDRMDPEK